MKYLSLSLFLLTQSFFGFTQKKVERLETNWPPEFEWKIVQRQNDAQNSELVIIPGRETINDATIVGVISAAKGLKFTSCDSIIVYYRNQMDQGSSLTVLDTSKFSNNLWVLFKVETPKTLKYPDPESDLYYIAQGNFALYDTHVAIKKASLSPAFVQKWSSILASSKIAIK